MQAHPQPIGQLHIMYSLNTGLVATSDCLIFQLTFTSLFAALSDNLKFLVCAPESVILESPGLKPPHLALLENRLYF